MKRLLKKVVYVLIIFIFLFISYVDSKFNINNKTNNCNYYNENLQKQLNDLNQSLGIDYKLESNYIISKVKYRDIYSFKKDLTIYNGKNKNIKNNLAVINNEGLIGITKKVFKNTTKVELLTNKKTNISIRINNVYGLLKADNNNLIVDTITNDEVINVGDLVYTSGIGMLPDNILVGEVNKVITDDLGLQKLIYVKPAVDFNNINYLFVVGVV